MYSWKDDLSAAQQAMECRRRATHAGRNQVRREQLVRKKIVRERGQAARVAEARQNVLPVGRDGLSRPKCRERRSC